MTPSLQAVLDAIAAERARQDAKWGPQDYPSGTGLDSDRYNADLARAICDEAARQGRQTWRFVLREEVYEAIAEAEGSTLRRELIQLAAVAVAWIECIDRRAAAESRP